MKPYQEKFRQALDADLNTSLAVTRLYDVLKAKDLSDDEKLALVGDFDAVLSLSLLEKAAAIRDAQKATSEVHGDGEYVEIESVKKLLEIEKKFIDACIAGI